MQLARFQHRSSQWCFVETSPFLVCRKFAAILAKLHSIVPKDITPLTKDNYRMMVFVKCGFKMIRQISDLERLEKWVTKNSPVFTIIVSAFSLISQFVYLFDFVIFLQPWRAVYVEGTRKRNWPSVLRSWKTQHADLPVSQWPLAHKHSVWWGYRSNILLKSFSNIKSNSKLKSFLNSRQILTAPLTGKQLKHYILLSFIFRFNQCYRLWNNGYKLCTFWYCYLFSVFVPVSYCPRWEKHPIGLSIDLIECENKIKSGSRVLTNLASIWMGRPSSKQNLVSTQENISSMRRSEERNLEQLVIDRTPSKYFCRFYRFANTKEPWFNDGCRSNSCIIVGLPVPKNIDPDFPQYFIRCYLEAKAELEGKSSSSVTNADVEKYYRWSQMCTLVSVCGLNGYIEVAVQKAKKMAFTIFVIFQYLLPNVYPYFIHSCTFCCTFLEWYT